MVLLPSQWTDTPPPASSWVTNDGSTRQATYSESSVTYSQVEFPYIGRLIYLVTNWFVNIPTAIDTWDNPNRMWDSSYTWDGQISQYDQTPSSWSDV